MLVFVIPEESWWLKSDKLPRLIRPELCCCPLGQFADMGREIEQPSDEDDEDDEEDDDLWELLEWLSAGVAGETFDRSEDELLIGTSGGISLGGTVRNPGLLESRPDSFFSWFSVLRLMSDE